jgi:hypothetical protein
VGTTPPPLVTLCERSPPNNGGINEVKLGAACGYHAAPVVCAAKRIPPSLGGIIQLERGGLWISRRLIAVAGKNPPQTIGGGGIKKLERSGVWVAHRSFASGRPNETVCGMHTASRVSGRSNEMVCGMHTASFASGRLNELVCGVHTVSLASEMTLQEGGGTNALLPTRSCPFRILPPPPSPSHFCPPCSLSLRDVAFDGVRFCWVTWHGRLSFAHIPQRGEGR